ncbi:hypothetical protein OIU80_15850 [Flavobacterium sp. LS1R47]|jgi:hypothetical protein|uniref:Uncharacterized protein n=1 Tax=Flavobacterium frigoritolerans TaxID=2987686 RepID=A0A9X2ZRS3_9FLAO|nr:hypothetical protein [Flavobacterium frigoritolerans]MCV9933756.1 hypothetical protein [Flavobacterium frigoritolerans]
MIKIISLLVFMLCSFLINAQSKTTSSSSSSSITKIDGVERQHSSISVNDSDTFYSLRAKFPLDKKEEIIKLLSDNIDEEYRSVSGKTFKWIKEENGQPVFSFVVTNDQLKISIEKDMISNGTFNKFKNLGESLKTVISNRK